MDWSGQSLFKNTLSWGLNVPQRGIIRDMQKSNLLQGRISEMQQFTAYFSKKDLHLVLFDNPGDHPLAKGRMDDAITRPQTRRRLTILPPGRLLFPGPLKGIPKDRRPGPLLFRNAFGKGLNKG